MARSGVPRLLVVLVIAACGSTAAPTARLPAPAPSAAPPAAAAPSACATSEACARACRTGDDAACSRYGALAKDADHATTLEIAKAGCEARSPAACVLGAKVAFDLDAAEMDYGAAMAIAGGFLERGCGLQAASACGLLGTLAIDGRGVRKDPERAIALWTMACDAGDADACGSLGFHLERAGRVDEAMRRHERACDGGAARSCRTLGMKHADGVGFEPSRERAAPFLQRACQSGDVLACANQRDVANRIYPLQRLRLQSFRIGHAGLRFSKMTRSKVEAKRLADAAVRALSRGGDIARIAKKYGDPEEYGEQVAEAVVFRHERSKAEPKEVEFEDRLFGLKSRTAYASENPTFGFVVFYRP